jgi:DNA gyrase subunit A
MSTTTVTTNGHHDGFEQEDFTSLFEDAFTQYALAVVTSRALPDARDGLKPVQRRILACMFENGYRSSRGTVKSASVVGDVLKSYHPHGDGAVYDAAVRMAQPFSLRYPLIEGQGNFGSIDGDTAAAYRYTEMRLSPIGELLLRDIEQETVPFHQTYLQDPKVLEPTYLPARIPPICNPASGIAVGLSTEIPPHNLTESIQAAIALLDDPEMSVDKVMKILKGPDFPSGGRVIGTEGIRSYFETGKGRIVIRAEVRLEEELRQKNLVITEVPPVSRARLVRSMINAVNDGKVSGVTDIRNESDEEKGTRIVVELERGATPEIVLNKLYRFSDLEVAISANMVFLFGETGQPARQPRQAGVIELLNYWNRHQIDVITRRSEYQLRKARERLHVVEGLIIGAANADEIVKIFQAARDRSVAKERIKKKYDLSDIQADVIANMTLAQVTRLDAKKYNDEKKELTARIKYLEDLLSSDAKKVKLLKEELAQIIADHGDERRTVIDDQAEAGEVQVLENLVEEQSILVLVSENDRIKAVPDNAFRRARAGTRAARREDALQGIIPANTTDYLLVLTRGGRVYLSRGHEISIGTRTSTGETSSRLFGLKQEEELVTVIPVDELRDDRYLVWFTAGGRVKKTALSEYQSVNAAGLNDMRLLERDRIAGALLVDADAKRTEYLLVSRNGQALRFSDGEVRATGRDGQGVNAMSLKGKDELVSVSTIRQKRDSEVVVVTERGQIKRTAVKEYPARKRGGAGVAAISLVKGDRIAGATATSQDNEVIVSCASGQSRQVPVSDLKRQGRATKGTRLFEVDGEDRVTVLGLATGR